MTRPNECMVCFKLNKDCHEIRIGSHLWGCIYCLDCLQSGKVKSQFLKTMENDDIFPCPFLLKAKLNLKFFRHSIGVTEEAKVFNCDKIPMAFFLVHDQVKEEKSLMFLLNFGQGFQVHRHVSVANIMKHSPGFYESIVNCENFLDTEIVLNNEDETRNLSGELTIGYDELPLKFKNAIESCRKLAQDTESCHFVK